MNTGNLVRRILDRSLRARDSDNVLIMQVLESVGMNLTQEQKEIFHSVSFESITRARRKFQQNGEYMPSPEVARQRRLKSYIVEQQAPESSPEHLQQLIQDQPKPIGKAIPWND